MGSGIYTKEFKKKSGLFLEIRICIYKMKQTRDPSGDWKTAVVRRD